MMKHSNGCAWPKRSLPVICYQRDDDNDLKRKSEKSKASIAALSQEIGELEVKRKKWSK